MALNISREETKENLEKQITELEKKKDLAYDRFKLGKLSKEKFISLKSKYDSEIQFLKEKQQHISHQHKNRMFTKLTREIVQENLKSIYVKNGEIKEVEYVD